MPPHWRDLPAQTGRLREMHGGEIVKSGYAVLLVLVMVLLGCVGIARALQPIIAKPTQNNATGMITSANLNGNSINIAIIYSGSNVSSSRSVIILSCDGKIVWIGDNNQQSGTQTLVNISDVGNPNISRCNVSLNTAYGVGFA